MKIAPKCDKNIFSASGHIQLYTMISELKMIQKCMEGESKRHES